MKKYTLLKKLGKGSFSDIYLTEYRNKNYAIKFYKPETNFASSFQKALEIAKKLRHDNIIRIYEFDMEEGYSLMEYFDGEHLDKIVDIKLKLSFLLPQIISGLQYLHKYDLIHGDIKPSNILVSGEDLKIADMDFLRKMKGGSVECKKRGTPFYIAPEILRGEYYNYKVDTWALGVTIYYLLKGVQPFKKSTREELEILILSDYSPEFEDLYGYEQIIREMLVKDPEIRIELKNVLLLMK